MVPEEPTPYQVVVDRYDDLSDKWPEAEVGVINGDLIYVVEFYREVGDWELRRFDYDAQSGKWVEMSTEGISPSIEGTVPQISIPTPEIDLAPAQEALPAGWWRKCKTLRHLRHCSGMWRRTRGGQNCPSSISD